MPEFQSVDNFIFAKDVEFRAGFSENVDDDDDLDGGHGMNNGQNLRTSTNDSKVPKVNLDFVKNKKDQQIMKSGKEVLETEPGDNSFENLTSDRAGIKDFGANKVQNEHSGKIEIKNAPNKLKVRDYFSSN